MIASFVALEKHEQQVNKTIVLKKPFSITDDSNSQLNGVWLCEHKLSELSNVLND